MGGVGKESWEKQGQHREWASLPGEGAGAKVVARDRGKRRCGGPHRLRDRLWVRNEGPSSATLPCEGHTATHTQYRSPCPCGSAIISAPSRHILQVPEGPCLFSLPALLAPDPIPLAASCRDLLPYPTPGLFSLVQLPEPSSQPLLHGVGC